ncbi:uncharacterized protein LOC141800612 [Halichoeres trimaculatus]|uniref:uncharacterized protein LOC141800612 n=1 Tax=Halichoeres trimaculatus TaxID=147232 RepID=UPI003D9DCFEA
MKKTFVCDDSMIITIPIGSLRGGSGDHLMPEKFHCVYKDSYKLFAVKGKPKPLGAAQTMAGVFIVALSLISGYAGNHDGIQIWILAVPSCVFVISGMLSYAAGRSPNIHVTKLSFSLNIISLFWSIVAVILCALWIHFGSIGIPEKHKLIEGIDSLILTLLVVEKFIALFLTYWLSKAVCRQHFNTLPIILLKQGD